MYATAKGLFQQKKKKQSFDHFYRAKIIKNDRQIAPTPRELSIQSSQIAQERYKWEKYRYCIIVFIFEFKLILMKKTL